MSTTEEFVEGNETVKSGKGRQLFKTKTEQYWKVDSEKAVKVDIIPFINKDGNGQIHFRYRVHKGIGPNKVSVACLKQFGKTCPICEQQKELYGGKKFAECSPETQKTIKALYPQERSICNVLVDGEIKLLDASEFKFYNPLQRTAKAFQELEKLTTFQYASPTKGYSLVIQWVKKDNPFSKDGGVFYEIESLQFRERKEQYPAKIMQNAYKLDTLFIEESEQVVSDLFFGAVPNMDLVDDEIGVEVKFTPTDENYIGVPETATNSTKEVEVVEEVPTCPAGGKFAADYDKLPQCDDCELFTECRKAFKNSKDKFSTPL